VTQAAPQKIDLARLSLDHGQGRRLELELSPPAVRQGPDQFTVAGAPVPGRLEISRTSGGWALHLSFDATLEGTCVRCLEPARLALSVDAREVDQPEAEDEELQSPYVEDLQVDVARWAHDALTLELPAQPLCREDCKGLCPDCGESLNDADPADHQHEKPRDPRWAALDDLKLDQ
jgi:DUF177 domain-containing protein